MEPWEKLVGTLAGLVSLAILCSGLWSIAQTQAIQSAMVRENNNLLKQRAPILQHLQDVQASVVIDLEAVKTEMLSMVYVHDNYIRVQTKDGQSFKILTEE